MNPICQLYTTYVQNSSNDGSHLFVTSSHGFYLEPKSSSIFGRIFNRICGTSYCLNKNTHKFLEYITQHPPTCQAEKEAYLHSCFFIQNILRAVFDKNHEQHSLYKKVKEQSYKQLSVYAEAKNSSPALCACSCKLYKMALYLLKKQNCIEEVREHLVPLLKEAHKDNNFQLCLHLVEAATSKEIEEASLALNKKEPKNGDTLLHLACRNLHFETVQKLLEAGSDVTLENNDGNVAMQVGLQSEDHSVFYMTLFASSAFAKDMIGNKGIDFFLHYIRTFPKECMKKLPSALEVAFLFNDNQMAKELSKHYTTPMFLEAIQAIRAKYPTSSLSLLTYCHISIDKSHLNAAILDLEVSPPSRNISLETLYTLLDDVDCKRLEHAQFISKASIKERLELFVARVEQRVEFKGTPKANSTAIKDFYDTIERAIKNILIYFEDAKNDNRDVTDEKCAFLREIIASTLLCAGRYMIVAIEQHSTLCKKQHISFEAKIHLLLAKLRQSLLESIIGPNDPHSVNHYNFFMQMRGKELGIPGAINYERYADPFGFINIEQTLCSFWKLYTPQTIHKWIVFHLQDSGDLRNDFIDWHKTHMPKQELEDDDATYTQIQEYYLTEAAMVAPHAVSTFLAATTPPIFSSQHLNNAGFV